MTAGKKGGRQEAPYNFEPLFERGVVYLACTQPRFMAHVAHELRPELLGLPECKLALEAAQAIFRETGQSPTSYGPVLQEVASKRDEGKITQEQVKNVSAYFDFFDDRPLPRAEEYERGALKVVKSRLRFAIAQAGIDEHGAEEWDKVEQLRSREKSLGRKQAGVGITASPANVIAALKRFREMPRTPFGITALDESFGIGVPRGTLTCFMAGPGGAKSMTMSHIAGQLSLKGQLVAYASLELPSEQVTARVASNQSGFTIDEIVSGAVDEEYHLRMSMMAYVPPVIQYFDPHVTTCSILRAWVDEIQQLRGQPLDVLVVDYADKLTATGKPDEKGMYHEMRIVYEQLRGIADELKLMGITASQSKARDEKKSKVIDLEHTADSIHKARIVDQFITLNMDDTTREMTFFLAKNRYGEGRKKAGPVPTNFACGQVSPVERALPPSVITHVLPTQNTPLVAPWEDEQPKNEELPL